MSDIVDPFEFIQTIIKLGKTAYYEIPVGELCRAPHRKSGDCLFLKQDEFGYYCQIDKLYLVHDGNISVNKSCNLHRSAKL
jgi:hypothetical protein